MRNLTGVVVALALACAPGALGCKKDQPKTDDTSTSKPKAPEEIPSGFSIPELQGADGGPPSNDQAAAPSTAPPAAANFTLVDAGADPKVKRRYAVAVGHADTMKATITSTVKTARGEGMGPPPMTFAFSVTAKDKAADGTETFAVKLAKVDVPSSPNDPPQMAMMMKQLAPALKALAGVSGTFKLDPRGSTGPFTLDPGQAQMAQLGELGQMVEERVSQALQGMFVQFPDDAVGKGAHWTEQKSSNEGGVTTTLTSDSTMTDLTGDEMTVSVKTTRSAPAQPLNAPEAPKGTTVAIDGTSTMTVKVKLDRMTKKSTGEATMNVNIVAPAAPAQGGQPATPAQTQQQTINVKQTVESQ